MVQSLPMINIVFQSKIGGYEIVKYVPSGWNFIVYIKNKAKYYLGGCMFRYIIRWTDKMKRMLMVLSFKNILKIHISNTVDKIKLSWSTDSLGEVNLWNSQCKQLLAWLV